MKMQKNKKLVQAAAVGLSSLCASRRRSVRMEYVRQKCRRK